MMTLIAWVVLFGGSLFARAAPASRPVRNDSEISSALSWMEYNYGEPNESPLWVDGRDTRAARAAAADAAYIDDAARSVAQQAARRRAYVSAPAAQAPLVNNTVGMAKKSSRKVLATGNLMCPLSLSPAWTAELGASVHSAPVVFPIFGDGYLQAVVPTFHRCA